MPLPRTCLLLVASLAVPLVPVALADPPKPEPAGARIARLIKRLGSESFQEREAATKALQDIGEPALEPLQQAATTNPDLEVRQRARSLLASLAGGEAREIARIKTSNLTPAEKGRKLMRFIRPGMTRYEVEDMLGPAARRGRQLHHGFACFPAYDLVVEYDFRRRIVQGVRRGP